MTDKELQKLNRAGLLELLIAAQKENESLKEQLAETQQRLQKRKIELTEAGSIAQAALQLNGIFEAADKAAAEYLENVKALGSTQEMVCEQRDRESREAAKALLQETQEKADQLFVEAQRKAEEHLSRFYELTRQNLENMLHATIPAVRGEPIDESDRN